jgi:hypothetical protein
MPRRPPIPASCTTSTWRFRPTDHGGQNRASGRPPAPASLQLPRDTAGRERMPVNLESFIRRACASRNWLNNGQGRGDPRPVSYTLLGGTYYTEQWRTRWRAIPEQRSSSRPRHEWFKARLLQSLAASLLLDYPAGSDTPDGCTVPRAAWPTEPTVESRSDDFTAVGSYPGSASPSRVHSIRRKCHRMERDG